MSAFIAGLGGAFLSIAQKNVNYANNFAPVPALFWLVLVVSLSSRTVTGAAQAGGVFMLFDAVILKGAFLGWILGGQSRIPGLFPIEPQWRFVLFGSPRSSTRSTPKVSVRHPPSPPGSTPGWPGGAAARRRQVRPTRRACPVLSTHPHRPANPSRRRDERAARGHHDHQVVLRHTALDGVDLHVAEGERVGLIGPNGAGKTTFFDCLLGINPQTSGSFTFDGRVIDGLSVHRRAKAGIGRTFQRIELFADTTVREHLLIAERVRNGAARSGRTSSVEVVPRSRRRTRPTPSSSCSGSPTWPTTRSRRSAWARVASSRSVEP